MTPFSRHTWELRYPVVIVAICFLLPPGKLEARGVMDGRMFLTYQNFLSESTRQEVFTQNLETALRDVLYEKNNLMIALYIDNSRNLLRNETIRRYWGRLQLSGTAYTFNARVSPRQKRTPLETEPSRELAESEVSIDVRPSSLPEARLSYRRRREYADGGFMGYSREIRADVRYRRGFVEITLNRWQQKSTNVTETTNTASGGSINLAKACRNLLTFKTGYQYQLTESKRGLGARTSVGNHTLSTLLTGKLKNYVSGSVSLVTRRRISENDTLNYGRDDTFSFQMSILPQSPVRLDLSRSYLSSERDGARTLSDYGTVQLILSGSIRVKTRGRAQIVRRFAIQTADGVIPANLYYLSLSSQVFRGLDLRANVSISQRSVDQAEAKRYQITSIVDVFTRPRNHVKLSYHAQYLKYSNRLSLVRNDRSTHSLKLTYLPGRRFSFGVDAQRTVLASGSRQEDASVVVSSSLSFRDRSSISISYGINRYKARPGDSPDSAKDHGLGETFNLQTQIRISTDGVLSVNYSNARPKEGLKTRYATVGYRQGF